MTSSETTFNDAELSISDATLIARLREGATWDDDVAAADRIEQLVATNEALTAKLAKAVEALETIEKPKVGPDFDWAEDEVNRWRAVWYRKYADIARATLAAVSETHKIQSG